MLAGSIFLRISDLGTLVERRWAEALAPFGISPGEYRVLDVLVERGPLSAVDISPHVTLDQSLISRTVQRLYEKRLVSRRRSRTDRRNVTLRATPAGNELAQQLAQPLQDLAEELTQGIPCEQFQEAAEVVAAIIKNLESPRQSRASGKPAAHGDTPNGEE